MHLQATEFLSLSRELLARGCHLRFQAPGNSMLPGIRNGNVIQVEPVDVTSLRLGDIIFYCADGSRHIAHRLISKRLVQGRMMFFTRGDSLPWSAVEQVEPEQVLGRVVAIEWLPGLRLRLDSGLGRSLGLLLSRISPLVSWTYTPLSRLKGGCLRALGRPRVSAPSPLP